MRLLTAYLNHPNTILQASSISPASDVDQGVFAGERDRQSKITPYPQVQDISTGESELEELYNIPWISTYNMSCPPGTYLL